MTTSTLHAPPAAASEPSPTVGPPVFEVRVSPAVRVINPAKLEKALNAILALDLGVKAERLIRAEVREAIH